jgi:LacI family transcriptional regulator
MRIMKSDEIAKLAGVSRSTVSRVVNNYSNVPEGTRKKVMEIIKRYDYSPNTSARALAGKPHNTIGLFIISIAEKDSSHRIYQNNYFAPFMEIIVDALNSRGYYALVNVIYAKEDYDRIKQAFQQKRIDSGIIVGTEMASDVYGEILKRGCPLSIIDMDPEEARKFRGGHTGLTLINSMDYEGASRAVEYLIELGHTEIGLLAGRMCTYSGRERYKAYMDIMGRYGLPVRDDYLLKGEFLKGNTVQEVSRLMDRGKLPTAMFSCNDDMALAAIDIFRSRGIQVPRDISIIGFDDIAIASQVSPALTTVKVPIYEMARKAVDAVLGAIEGGDRSQSLVSLPASLIVRESCRSISAIAPNGSAYSATP